ncbi:MAG TPA: WD40 repeat domain-containing protein [Phycisphaerae bacterium]|nr:WD40 repeat domain-containing protein [Phycisphaerae bacterium]
MRTVGTQSEWRRRGGRAAGLLLIAAAGLFGGAARAGPAEEGPLAAARRHRRQGDVEKAAAELARAGSLRPGDPNAAALGREVAALGLRYRPDAGPMKGHTGWVYGVAFSPDGGRIASVSGDGTARLWQVGLAAPIHTFPGHLGGATCLAWSPDGNEIACGSVVSRLMLWQAAAPHRGVELKGHVGIVGGVAFSPDGRHLASGGFDQRVYIWDVSGAQQRPLIELRHDAQVVSLAFSPDGRHLATGCTAADPTVRIWDWRKRVVVRTVPAEAADRHTRDVHSLAFLPGGRELLSASHDRSIRIWDVDTGRLVRKLEFKDDWEFSQVAVAPDGVRAACACRTALLRFEVRVIDLVSGRTLQELGGKHTDFVTAVAFSPDGRRIVSGSRDNKLWLWSAAAAAGK